MAKINTKRGLALALAVVICCAGSTAAGISDPIFKITATSSAGTDSWSAPLTALDPNTGKWFLGGPQELKFGGGPFDVIATLNMATVTLIDDPTGWSQASMNFEIKAGADDVEIQVESAIIDTFLPGSESQGAVSASFTLTDAVSNGDTAVLDSVPSGSGHGLYRALYNGGQELTDLGGPLTVDSGGTSGPITQNWPPGGGLQAIGQTITDFQSSYHFTLTGTDLMSGQNTYYLTPEPTSVLLLSLAGVLALRRR